MIKPTRIIGSYMARHFLLSFLGILTIIMGLVLLFDTIELLRRTASRDASFPLVVEMALLKAPQMLQTIMPFAIMIGSMVAFWRLSRSRELVIIRAAGVSVWEFLTPVSSLALLVGILGVTVINPLSSVMYKRYEHLQDRLQMRHESPLTLSQSGLWLREAKDHGHAVVRAREVRQEGLTLIMRHLSVIEMEENEKFIRRIEAERSRLIDGNFEMESVWEMVPGKPSKFYPTYNLPTALSLGRIQENFASPETMSFWELPSFIRFFESAGFSAHRHRLYWHTLLASPLLLFAMVLVAAVFSLSPNLRQSGFMFRIVGGIASGFALFFFSRLTFALGLSATLPLALAAWSPAIIATLLSVSLLLHLEDG